MIEEDLSHRQNTLELLLTFNVEDAQFHFLLRMTYFVWKLSFPSRSLLSKRAARTLNPDDLIEIINFIPNPYTLNWNYITI